MLDFIDQFLMAEFVFFYSSKMAATLTGVLLDVSGSMKHSTGPGIKEKGGEWARCIFQVINSFIENDISSDNQIFSVGVGANQNEGIFDVIKTIDLENSKKKKYKCTSSYDEVVEDFFQIVEQNGATATRKWATKTIIQDAVPFEEAVFLLNELKASTEFLKLFVNKCLPWACRSLGSEEKTKGTINAIQRKAAGGLSIMKTASTDDVVKVLEKATFELNQFHRGCSEDLIDVGTVFSVQEASRILRFGFDDGRLNNNRIDEIMEAVGPFVYGLTPLYAAIDKTIHIFSKRQYSDYTKILFVLSDGCPTDHGDLPRISEKLKDLNVKVVSCFITHRSNIQPRKLYSVEEKYAWGNDAKFLFRLSSTVSSELLPRTIFIQKGWEIDLTNNETKLFLQINHQDHIHDACNLAKNVCCQDSLSDILASVSLDNYLNQSTYGFKAQEKQDKGTCYAHASATVLHLSMLRILGRDLGYPRFEFLRDVIVDLYGKKGACPLKVLTRLTPDYLLHCKPVDKSDALKAVTAKRPVVAVFYLSTTEWKQFGIFFRSSPTSILTKSVIDISRRNPTEKLGGHAVVLTSFNSKCFSFMNSWGNDWADKGFFRIKNLDVIDFEFTDVYWTLGDLSYREKEYYKRYSADVAWQLISKYKSLSTAEYQCPICKNSSPVTDYTGSLKVAVCPRYGCKFRCDESGNVIALNIYLSSLNT